MSVTIRKSTTEDAYDIAVFSRKSFYESFADQNTEENMAKFLSKFSVEILMAEVGSYGNTFLLAIQEDELVGYIKLVDSKIFTEIPERASIEIARIYVDKKMIGQGIGNRLMESGISLAKGLKKEVVWLGVWEHNSNAINFYTKWGFERFGEHIFMLGDDAQTDWLLKKELT